MAGKILRAAVVGASTLLGKELLDEISSSALAAWDLRVLEPGAEAEGQLTSAGDEALVVHALDEGAFEGLDVVFFAGDRELTQKYVETALRAGAAVIDLSDATSDREGFVVRSPLLQGGQRPDLMTQGISLPHPAAFLLSLVAERLSGKFGVDQILATVLEPASQAGSAGVDELHQQTVSLLSFQELPKAVFDAQVAFNLLGSLGEESSFRLEATRVRMERDLKRLGPAEGRVPVALSLLQAPVFHGYLISCFANFGAAVAEADVRAALHGSGTASEEDTSPSNQAATESGEILIHVRKDAAVEKGCWIVLAADNLRVTVRNAVAAATELAALRPGTRVQ